MYYAMDSAANKGTIQTNTYTIDTTLPTATADLSSGIFNKLKSVTLTAADNLDTNPLIYYSTDNGITWNNQQKTVTLNLNQGITTLMYYAMDSAANKGTIQTNTYTIDTTLPTATADLSSGIFNTLKSVTLTAADNLDTNPLIYYSTDNGITWNNLQKTVTLNLNQGITTLMYYAMDSAANKGTIQTNTYTIDTTLPTATADLSSGIFNKLKSVTLTAADNLDTNPLIYYSTDNGITWNNQQKTVTLNLNQGITTLMYYAMDSAANKGTIQTNTYTIDTTLPTATADLSSGIFNTLKSVTLTAADNLDTNPLIYYSTDNGITWNNLQKTVTLNLNQGITTLMYYAMDSAANKGTIQTNTYTIDTTLPTATADLSSGIFNTLKSVTLTAADNLDTNPLIYYSTDNGITWNNQQKTVTLNLNQGITTLMYYAMDSAANKGTIQTNTYTIDTTLPTATADLSSGIFNTLKSVTLTAADNLDTNPLIYYSTDNGITWNNQQKAVTLSLNQGITTLMYYAMDSATNKCTIQTNTYTIDTTVPTATADLSSGIFNTLKSVTLTAADNLDTNPLIYYSTDNGITWNNQQKAVTLNLNQGITTLMYYAMDSATNKCTIQTNTYTIDTTLPTATADLSSGIFNKLKSVTLTAADNLDTNPLIYYSTDNGTTWNNQQKTVTLNLNQGITTLMYYAMDSAANL